MHQVWPAGLVNQFSSSSSSTLLCLLLLTCCCLSCLLHVHIPLSFSRSSSPDCLMSHDCFAYPLLYLSFLSRPLFYLSRLSVCVCIKQTLSHLVVDSPASQLLQIHTHTVWCRRTPPSPSLPPVLLTDVLIVLLLCVYHALNCSFIPSNLSLHEIYKLLSCPTQ